VRTLIGGLMLCLSTAVGSPQSPAQIFRSGVQTVFVDASVLRGRSPVDNLAVADFNLSDNGFPQRIDSVSGVAIPLDVSLVFDASWYTLGPVGADELRRNAQQLAALLQADDRLAVLTFALDVEETRAMSAVGPQRPVIALTNPTTSKIDRRFRVAQALLTALAHPVSSDRRHVVVLFAAGRGEPELPSLEFLASAATRSDALLHVVLTPERRTFDRRALLVNPSEVVIREAVSRAAEATGGKVHLTGDIVGAFQGVLKEFRSSYVLRYTLEGVPSAGWHDIVVKVPSCQTCTIRARRGYMGR